MARERRNAPDPSRGERVRRRLSAQPELELSAEELSALADEGIDPDDVRRLARERSDTQEASEHDRDTARDKLEGLVAEHEQDYE
ncbi:MAG: hypothetical protein H0V19_00480 [Euzebyales bacterium]|nr:hypothetical protein [Euzebyales bacterium]